MKSILEGITVLEFAEYIAGPYCGFLLSDLGARVIKVEPPDGAEERRLGNRERYRGNTRPSLAFNRGKESLAVDLRRPEGRELIYRLIPGVDVVIQNFVPGVATKLGIDYASLSAKNPRLVFLSSTAFGEVGPLQKRKGFDIIAHAAAGIMANYADELGAPRGPGALNYVDISTAVFNALGIVSALYHRLQTGEGQKLETSLFGTGLALQQQLLVNIARLDGARQERELELLRTARHDDKTHTQVIDEIMEARLREDMPTTTRPVEVPDCLHRPTDRQVYPYYRVYPTADGYLCVAALNRSLREKLCHVLGVTDPHVDIDLGNASDEAYFAQKAMMKTIEERLSQHSNDHWMERLEAAGVPCGPVSYGANLYEDPQVKALDMMWRLENQELGAYDTVGHPIRFSKTRVTPGKGAPTLGQDTDALLAEAGLGKDEIRRYREAGVVK